METQETPRRFPKAGLEADADLIVKQDPEEPTLCSFKGGF
jgi:hypothetical protein